MLGDISCINYSSILGKLINDDDDDDDMMTMMIRKVQKIPNYRRLLKLAKFPNLAV